MSSAKTDSAPIPKPWVYGYCVTFNDGGPPEYQMLGEGDSEEECAKIADLLPAICYSGSRPVQSAVFIWTRNKFRAIARAIMECES